MKQDQNVVVHYIKCEIHLTSRLQHPHQQVHTSHTLYQASNAPLHSATSSSSLLFSTRNKVHKAQLWMSAFRSPSTAVLSQAPLVFFSPLLGSPFLKHLISAIGKLWLGSLFTWAPSQYLRSYAVWALCKIWWVFILQNKNQRKAKLSNTHQVRWGSWSIFWKRNKRTSLASKESFCEFTFLTRELPKWR